MRRAVLAECDDTELLSRAREGDREAFGELVRRHQGAARRVAAIVSGSTEEADDIVQDAFVSVHRGLASYRGSGSVRSWMLRAVANTAKNSRRGARRRVRREDREAALSIREAAPADEAVMTWAELRELADALVTLSPRDREVLGCRFVAGLTEAETAEVLDVPVGTVKSRTARALARLQDALDARGPQ
jgi:RNA polymerase sigma factor (sigma-70 family)